MKEAKAPPCEFLTWDTEFFGHRIGRIRDDSLSEGAIAAIEEWRGLNQIEALYFLSRADDPKSISLAEHHGFNLADVRMTYELSPIRIPASRQQPPDSSAKIRVATLEDIPLLREIARTAHRETRFFNDAHFDRAKAETLYETWIELDCRGRAAHAVVAANESNRAVGYLTCHVDRKAGLGSIGLLGVGQDAQGRGLGSRLVIAALEWFLAQGMQQVNVVTQANNVKAQRLYQRCGFLTANVQLWYHKWYSRKSTNQPGAKSSLQ